MRNHKTSLMDRWALLAAVLTVLVYGAQAVSLGGAAPAPVLRRDITTGNRSHCPESEQMPRPPNRVDTVQRLIDLRAKMAAVEGGEPVDAYIVLISDDHGVITFTQGSHWDARVEFISGFSGSNGFALVTEHAAALWTDGRYFLQAEDQLDCAWILMKIGTPGYPTGPEWLAEVLPDDAKVGAYPNYVSIDTWNSYTAKFAARNITMVKMAQDLVDKVWDDSDETRPEKPNKPLIVHTLSFTGESSMQKVHRVRAALVEAEADCLVVTILEEVAWLFNLRGSDRTDSLFYGYAIIFPAKKSKLFVQNRGAVLADAALRTHLGVNADGSCVVDNVDCIEIFNYTSIITQLEDLTEDKVWVDPSASYAVYSAVTEDQMLMPMERSPIALMKAIKNSVERTNFFNCILRDSASVVEFVARLEEEIAEGKNWTEVSASDALREVRATYEHNMGLSFETISAVGSNAAIIHYRPMPETDRNITTNDVYLLDSGGQYLDGTTDVTRTFHFGTPKDIEKEAYTRVLMGAIDLSMTVWPEGYYGSDLDVRARTPLWQNGWDYNHGTGHGIGYFLSVHEGPGRINMGFSASYSKLYEGMFFSDEPGYYEDGQFGIRLETLVMIEKANTTHRFGGKQFLTFREATLVPFEPKMIKYELLSQAQKGWLSEYHKRCEDETGKYLLEVRGDERAYEWLLKRTRWVEEPEATTPLPPTTLAAAVTSSAVVALALNIALSVALYA